MPDAAKPGLRPLELVLASIGAGGAVAVLGLVGEAADAPLLIAPLGASAVLVFGLPAAPLAQPRAVIGGSLAGAAVGLLVVAFLGTAPWAIGLGVGLALSLMLATRTLHAPAGGMPVLIAGTHPDPLVFLAALLAATVLLVAMGAAYHRLVTRQAYPQAWI
jgi:CBS-domain-containing membrane protein